MLRIKCYYCNCKNFGDRLNTLILEKFLGTKICWSPYEKATIIGIGSIIEAILRKNDKRASNSGDVYCFSSGFAKKEQITDLASTQKPSLLRPVKYWALRGLKTKQLLIDYGLLSNDENVVLGDGGLLASFLLDKMPIKKYKVGIVPHEAEKSYKIFSDLRKIIPNSVILNAREDPLKFMRQIAECETIISTAMHPLIVSDSLGIPNLWIRLDSNKSVTDLFKFEDYYSVYGLEKRPLSINDVDSQIYNRIIESYNIPKTKVENIKNDLVVSISNLAETLRGQYGTLNKEYRRFIWYELFVLLPSEIFIHFPKRCIYRILRYVKQIKNS